MNYTYLTEFERYHIDELLRSGLSQSAIADELGRSKSTISRELQRNEGKRGWRPRQAEIKSLDRLSERGENNARKVSELAWNYARNKLTQEQWSPEQIAGRIQLEKLDSISHETIYQRILDDKQSGGDIYTHLRCKKKRRKRYGAKTAGRGCIANRVDIEKRPAIVDSRRRVGDWEGDTVIGSYDGGAVIATMVERKSRYTVIAKSENKTTISVINGILAEMKPFSELMETITFDNGKEFSGHKRLTEDFGASIYFARPYHSWERGLNENTNGLIRQYFPKKTSFDNIDEQQFQAAADKLNARPRKCLAYKTPREVMLRLAERKGISLSI
jgi:IS30 family transposase